MAVEKNLIKKAKNLPVPVIAAFVGLVTVANAWNMMFGMAWLRHISFWVSMGVWLAAFTHIVFHFKKFKENYFGNVIFRALYAAFTMLTFAIAAYLLPYTSGVMRDVLRYIWLIALITQMLHNIWFIIDNVFRKPCWDTTVPAWFVSFNGILVSVVVGGQMGFPRVQEFMAYYGIAIYLITIPFMIYRINTKPYKEAMLHTKCVVIAPVALTTIAILNAVPNPPAWLVFPFWFGVLISVSYFIYLSPKYFAKPFVPGWAGLTFPNAAGVVASFRFSQWTYANGFEAWSGPARQIAGIQLWFTTTVCVLVAFKFLQMFWRSFKPAPETVEAGK